MGCINSTNKQLYPSKTDVIFNVSVVRVQSDQSMILARHGFLEISPNELIFIAPEQVPVAWALQHLRRYGLTGNIFSFEAGRRCPTGPGIFSFRCCNADQFYAKFQRCINSMSVVGDRSNSSAHPSHIFGRLESHQPHTNHYLEPTSVQVTTSLDEPSVLIESFSNNSNDFILNSPDSVQSTSLTAEIIHFPSSAPSYSNVSPNPHSNSNIYMEQPIRINNEHNNNISTHEITYPSNTNNFKSELKPLLKSSSLDVPPKECAPILKTNNESQRLYENIDASLNKSANISQNNCSYSSERFYANIELLPRLDPHIGESTSFPLDLWADQQQSSSANGPIVNYIVLDLDHPRSPSQCSPKNGFGSGQSLSESGPNIANFNRDEIPSTASGISCGSSTMPKGSTMSDEGSTISNNKMESSGSYTRIDFLKTFALMKSSTNTDFDLDNDQEESRITRHSKFVRKAYSISE